MRNSPWECLLVEEPTPVSLTRCRAVPADAQDSAGTACASPGAQPASCAYLSVQHLRSESVIRSVPMLQSFCSFFFNKY